ncbi:MAG: hypothetical protein ABGY96_01515 [bacterium]
MKRRNLRVTVAVALLLALVSSGTAWATFITVEVDGVNYELTTALVSYENAPELLESQPWWDDPDLATDIADEVRYQLGDLEGGNEQSGGIPSALVAWGIFENFVSISYWNGELQFCPDDCPEIYEVYSYVVVGSHYSIPANPLWSLIMMAAFLAAVAAMKLSRSEK